jgi:hypothetical protein
MTWKGGRHAWQDAQDAKLTRLWNEGRPAQMIADLLGFGPC